MNLRSRPLLVAGVLLLAAVSVFAARRLQNRNGGDGYLTEPVERGAVASTVTATGTLNPVSTVQVGTYVSGPIRAIFADYNSRVTTGQLVAKIDPAPFDMKVRSAEANVANARARVEKDRADLTFKKLTLERNRKLLGKQLISQNDVDTAKSAYDQAAAQVAVDGAAVQQAQADLEAARINLAYTDIRSPVDGVVVSRSVDVGQTVAASFQTPTLFLIAQDLTKMQVDTNVSESDIGGVEAGQPASFQVDAYPEKDFKGTVGQVRNAPITVQNVVTYDVVITVDNSDLQLRPGMTATVTITTARRDDVLKLPLRALRFRPARAEGGTESAEEEAGAGRRRGRGSAVWMLGSGGALKRVEVRTGLRDDRYAELVGGELHEKDAVVVAENRPTTATPAGQLPPFVGGGRRYR